MIHHTARLVMAAAMAFGIYSDRISDTKPLSMFFNEQSSGRVTQQSPETVLPNAGNPTSYSRYFGTVASRNAYAKDYYVSASGDDSNPGTNPDFPLRSLERVSALSLHPGDHVFFRSGETFSGNLKLVVPDGGSVSEPIEIASYGPGHAIIRPQSGDGIVVRNVSGLIIRNLTVAGTDDWGREGENKAFGNGIRITSADADRSPSGILISDVEVYGFRTDCKGGSPSRAGNGILIDTQGEGKGVQNIVVARANIHHQDYAGINSMSASGNRHENISVLDSEVCQNSGIRGAKCHTGSGIVLSAVNGALVEGCTVHDNGENNEADGGSAGVWAWEAKGVAFRRNISYRNHTLSNADGDAFDFDGGVTDSIMEDNISFDNDGAAYLVCTYPGSKAVRNIIIRNNRSMNDGRKNSYGALYVFGDIRDVVFEGNDVRVGPSDTGQPCAVKIEKWTGNNIEFRNNHFNIDKKAGLFSLGSAQGLKFSENSVGARGAGQASFRVTDQQLNQEIALGRDVVKQKNPLTIQPD